MYSFFAEHDNISKDFIRLEGSVYNHIKNVLRLDRELNLLSLPEIM